MPVTQETVAQPAASAAAPALEIDYDKLAAAVAKATTAIAGQAKTAEAAPAKEAEAGKTKPITLEDLTNVLNQRDTAAKSHADRANFLASKMKDLPAAYQAKLGSDPTKWAAEEQAIRAEMRADFKAMGFKVPDVGGETIDGKTVLDPGAAIDMSKMTASQKIGLGLKNSKPARPPSTTAKVGA